MNKNMGKENVKTSVETITPEIAREWMKFNINNRPLSRARVKKYENALTKGEFVLNGESIIFSDGGILMQGQHRLKACINTGISFDSVVVRGVEYSTFSTLDSGGTRTMADVFAIHGTRNSHKMSTLVSFYAKLNIGGTLRASQPAGINRLLSKKEVLEVYERHGDVFESSLKIAARMNGRKRLLSESFIGGVVSYLVIDKKHPIEFVEAFFEMLFFGRNVPIKAIEQLEIRLTNNLASTSKMTPTYQMAIFVKAWNAYVTRKDLSRLSWNEAKESMPEFL